MKVQDWRELVSVAAPALKLETGEDGELVTRINMASTVVVPRELIAETAEEDALDSLVMILAAHVRGLLSGTLKHTTIRMPQSGIVQPSNEIVVPGQE